MGRQNDDLSSPTLVDIVQSDTVEINPSLRALDIFADGDVTVTDITGVKQTRTFTNVAPCFRWVVQIRQVWDTGTDLTNAQMSGLR